MNYQKLDQNYYYDGNDLGSICKEGITSFRVWAPTAERVVLCLYKEGTGDNLTQEILMEKQDNGTWYYLAEKDLHGVYYTYQIDIDGQTNEAVDVYAKAAGVNGERGMIVDLEKTNPDGWDIDKKPELKQLTDTIIYELHMRDLSSDKSANIQNIGKYIQFTEEGTKSKDGLATGIDHLKEMGVTHVHLLPLHDYGSVDEAHLEKPQFNWGYDPINYNVPEGSYSTDPFHGEVRIKEFKEMVQALHKNGIRVIMDVVYNHTYKSIDSNLNKTVPGYYYRMEKGKFANGSGCGNETASDHKMMGKYMVDSLCYWAKEYHIDGFRFDLMAIHDIHTMNEIAKEMKKIDPTIILYGEGWASQPPLPDKKKLAFKDNAKEMPDIGMFSDDIRDSVKGNVFILDSPGFVNGKEGLEEYIKACVVGATKHSEVDYDKLENMNQWALEPTQSINYVSAHDDITLWDKLACTNPQDSVEDRREMNKMAAGIVFTAQGIPFIQAGEEFLRTKPGKKAGTFIENSYNSPDSVNSLKWHAKKEEQEVCSYYEGLIAFRKAHPALRMATTMMIDKYLHFLSTEQKNVVAYTIDKPVKEEIAEQIAVIYNGNRKSVSVSIPEGEWNIFINKNQAGVKVIDTLKVREGEKVEVKPISVMVLAR